MCGRLEMVVGPMFAGKTTEILRRVQEATAEGLSVVVYKPRLDTRHQKAAVISHDGLEHPAKWVEPFQGMPFSSDVQVIAIDEVQFFSDNAIPHILNAVRQGRRVIAAGLDLTSAGQPFGPVPALLALADDVLKLCAVCRCGEPATRSQRLVPATATVLVGGSEAYEPRCFRCFRSDLEI